MQTAIREEGTRILLREEQWNFLERSVLGARGAQARPNDREVLERVLWVLIGRARWRDLDGGPPSPVTCWRRRRVWELEGTWPLIWGEYVRTLSDRERLAWASRLLAILVGRRRGGPRGSWWSRAVTGFSDILGQEAQGAP